MMAGNATAESREFVFLKDIDGMDAPITVGSIVSAINSGAVPGFAALNSIERDTLNVILADAEHHHRYEMLHSADAQSNWDSGITRNLAEAERRIRNIRKRLGLPLHYEDNSHCPYLKVHSPSEDEEFWGNPS